jgi:type II restriction/modification system DNA methylase subunit YeeA
VQHVKPEREKNNREAYRKYWWRHGEPRIAMRATLKGLPRYIATVEVSKHRFFVWLPVEILPDKRLIILSRSDDTTFGILHSRFHEIWSLRLGATLEDRPCYRPSTSFETFPFPEGLMPNLASADYKNSAAAEIAAAAQKLNELRENWLNPQEWTERIPEVVAGYPARIIAKPDLEAELKKRTLTNLYNARPAWLSNAHNILDAAVAQAYGWDDYTAEMSDEEILRRLLKLNLARAKS